MIDARYEQRGDLGYLVRAASPGASGRASPLLVFLHGFDEGAPTNIEHAMSRHGPLRPESAAASRAFIVVAPQLPRCGDLWSDYAGDVRDVVNEVIAADGADAHRVYLTGFSFGGNGVFDLALAYPDLWAALWPVDPTRVPAQPIPQPVWLSVGEAARRATDRYIAALELQPAGKMPRGDRLYLDEGADHVGSATRAYADPRIYAWLLEHSR